MLTSTQARIQVRESFYIGVRKAWLQQSHVLRLGQAFLNAILTADPDPELFYERDANVCEKLIYSRYIDPHSIGQA